MPRIFISYQTRAHRPYIPELKRLLLEAEVSYWVDDESDVPYAWVGGREYALLRGLRSADALLLLSRVPYSQVSWLDKVQSWREGADDLARLLVAAILLIPILAHTMTRNWYRFLYGVDVSRRPAESWQGWEARIGELLARRVERRYAHGFSR